MQTAVRAAVKAAWLRWSDANFSCTPVMIAQCWSPKPVARFISRCCHVGKAAVSWCEDLAAEM